VLREGRRSKSARPDSKTFQQWKVFFVQKIKGS